MYFIRFSFTVRRFYPTLIFNFRCIIHGQKLTSYPNTGRLISYLNIKNNVTAG